MIHPNTKLKMAGHTIGLGVFATQFIPKGTIVYVVDGFDVKIGPKDPLLKDPNYQPIINRYSYTDEKGNRIISWDHAKFVNHCCDCNTISTGYGFEIAIRNIYPGDEITDEYGALNIEEPMALECCAFGCRKNVYPNDLDIYHQEWDKKIIPALKLINNVDQPLAKYIDEKTRRELDNYLKTGKNYKSIYQLKYIKTNGMHPSAEQARTIAKF